VVQNQNLHLYFVNWELKCKVHYFLYKNPNRIPVAIDFVLGTHSSGPRVAEIKIAHSPNILLLEAEPGKSILNADKEMVAQQQEEGSIRIIIYGTSNLNALETGKLAKLFFEKKDRQPSTLEIVTQNPIFAPEQANQGLLVSDPVNF